MAKTHFFTLLGGLLAESDPCDTCTAVNQQKDYKKHYGENITNQYIQDNTR